MKIKTFLSDPLLALGVRQYILWDMEKVPHVAVSGATGTGKTYATKLLMARIARYIPDSKFTVCDFKGDSDFSFLSDSKRFYRFDHCLEGLNSFYDLFWAVQKSGKKQHPHFLVFDEWASFLNSLEKKETEEAKKKLSSLLMLGRSFDFHVILSQQRLDAEYFGKCRDNFNLVVVLGNPSKEVQGMFFQDYREEITNDRTRGTGYMLTNGTDFQKIVVPKITSMDTVNQTIIESVLRYSPSVP